MYWQFPSGFETIRHTTLHLGKLMGKLSAYCEAIEDGRTEEAAKLLAVIDAEVVPDLLIYAARLATDRGQHLGAAFTARMHHLRERERGETIEV